MEIKNIIEMGYMVEVKLYDDGEPKGLETLNDIHEWFEKEKSLGYQFLKAFKENGRKYTMFIKIKDHDKIIEDLKKQHV